MKKYIFLTRRKATPYRSTVTQHGVQYGKHLWFHYVSRIALMVACRDIASKTATTMNVLTNTFCASGSHLPNGSYVTFGGNGAIGPGGNIGSQKNAGGSGAFDATYQDYDGTKSIRVLNPCTSSQNFNDPNCQWFDNPAVLSMQKQRWYSSAESLPDGSVVLIGGFVNGGYVNRNTPNIDPTFEGGAAEPTFEFYPSRGGTPAVMNFMVETSGLNAYAHAFLMPSGKMFVQANLSTSVYLFTLLNGAVCSPSHSSSLGL